MREIRYAARADQWADWMLEYRYGAFYIFPPAGVIEPVDALRRQYDPKSAGYCQAHISLSEPLSQPLNESQFTELKMALSKIPEFDLHYGPLLSFPPHPGVVYSVRPEDRFRELQFAVHSNSMFAATLLKRMDVAPHMTIAEFITLGRTKELLGELQGQVPEGSFPCGSIEYAVPNEEFYFERVLRIPIGSEESAGKGQA